MSPFINYKNYNSSKKIIDNLLKLFNNQLKHFFMNFFAIDLANGI